jgi:acetamidase/formamidase
MAIHRIEPHRSTLHGTFSPAWEPALTIDAGDTVLYSTLDARWGLEPMKEEGTSRRFAPRSDERDNGHALCGPIFINGAHPGSTLVVLIGPIRPADWGWNVGGGYASEYNDATGVGEGTQGGIVPWTIDRDNRTATNGHGITVGIDPFFGVMGMPAADPQPVPSWTPRPQGGNIDCRALTSGTQLFLPIAVPGGLFSAGDGHARQGDGEVSGTAIECPFEEAELTFSLRDDLALTTPMARTHDSWITFGFDTDLDTAALIAVDAMLDLLGREYGLQRNVAMSLASVVVDLRVTQIVNGVKGVHAILKDDDFDLATT